MKSICFYIIKILFTVFGHRENESIFSKIYQQLYSFWICQKFKCTGVQFKRKINTIKGTAYIKIGKGTSFGRLMVLTAWNRYGIDEIYEPSILIGERCNFGDYVHITAINKITIGNNVLTGRWVTITDNGHGSSAIEDLKIPPLNRKLYSKGPVIVEDDVWIGDKATILPGVTIGRGAVIAANSVVTKDIPPFSIAAGNPAKIIKSQSF